MTSTRRHRRLTVAVGACVFLIAGVALAYWSGTGTGAGAGSSSTADLVTLTPGTPTAQLYPGGSSAVVTKITNGGSTSVRVSSLALSTAEGDSGFDTDDSHADCPTDGLSFPTQNNSGSGWTVPASGSVTVTMPASLAMATTAADSCQGATFTVYLRVAS